MEGSPKVWRPREIRQRYELGERDFRGVEVYDEEGALESFQGAALDGADFTDSCMVVDFRGASLRRCRFVRASVKTCYFDGSDLEEADFSEAMIDSATFEGARLTGAEFAGAGAYGYTFKRGELP